jgi:hypothetical protein
MSNNILETCRNIGGGTFIDQASDKLAELIRSVNETGRSGKIELVIGVKKATRGGAMHLTGKVKLTRPAEEPMEAMLFSTEDGRLLTEDPNQSKLDLRVVAEQSPQLKTINQD